jgi:hypothetical protein
MSLFRSKLQDALYFLHNLDGYLFHWTFYRIRPTCFIFVIIVASMILYVSNKSFHLSYSDATVLCTCTVTNTGLTTVNLSALTTRQRAILIILMLMEVLRIVTVVVVYIRKSYFKKHLQELVDHNTVAGRVADDIEKAHHGEHQRRQIPGARPVDVHRSEPRRGERKTRGSAEGPTNPAQASHARGYGAFSALWETQIFHVLLQSRASQSTWPSCHWFRLPLPHRPACA